jgi:DNA replication and repair protein RecF
MIFSSLRTTSFRNLADNEVFTGSKDVFLVGENGQGKTNFLEALYFCAYASSFRAVHDGEIACNDTNGDFSAEVKINQSANDSILVKHEKGKKAIFINGKRAEDRKELLSIAPCIVFCHEDMDFVSGAHERRRWFFDQTLSLYDPVYLEDLRRYRRVLKSRNAVLRDFRQDKLDGSLEDILDALDPQFASYGQKLIEKREVAARQFSEVFGPLYEEVSGIKGITVQYTKSWKYTSCSGAAIQSGTMNGNTPPGSEEGIVSQELLTHLREKRGADIACGLSLSGPHRDRYIFAHNGKDFTSKASTGQKRLLALLLRTAQSKRFSQMTGQNPILLLDDVLLEMDGEKRRRFLSVMPAYDQSFFTFLPEEPYQRYSSENTLIYKVRDGILRPSGRDA